MSYTSFVSSSGILVIFLVQIIISSTKTIAASTDGFVYGGCSHIKYLPNSQYESDVNSLLTTLVNSAIYSPFNKFTTGSSNSPLYGLYQCRGDLSQSDCSNCVQRGLSQLGVLCPNSCGGVLQLDGCFIKYDNATFIGVEDRTVVVRKCGNGLDSDELTRRDRVLSYLASRSEFYRVGVAGNVQGVAQCVGDLSVGQCSECVVGAVKELRSYCGQVGSGDVYLAKCYVRVVNNGGSQSDGSSAGSSQDEEIEKTLAILIGLIAGVALIIVLLSFLSKLCQGKDGK